ncbi:uncharacterized protein LOC130719184 [Lotus japonicus]|uniref:uncharacterized protein LOC130719184 n=1 Tax=Lotus japonicus TaxID=34305 RepID=UPI002590B95E|nr:uncharacterized protein LOC130719184 [Lotus japonicus]
MGLNPSHASFSAGEPREWIKRVLVGAEASGLSTIWGIWTAQNQAVMAHNVIPVAKLLRLIQEQRQLLLRLWPPSQLPSQPRLVSWIAPVAPAIAVNCDVSSLGVPLRSGFGGCLRHADGAWITGFLGYGGQGLVLHMELLAAMDWKLCGTWGIGRLSVSQILCWPLA